MEGKKPTSSGFSNVPKTGGFGSVVGGGFGGKTGTSKGGFGAVQGNGFGSTPSSAGTSIFASGGGFGSNNNTKPTSNSFSNAFNKSSTTIGSSSGFGSNKTNPFAKAGGFGPAGTSKLSSTGFSGLSNTSGTGGFPKVAGQTTVSQQEPVTGLMKESKQGSLKEAKPSSFSPFANVTGGFPTGGTGGFGTSTTFKANIKGGFASGSSLFGAKPASATTEAEKEPEPATSAAQCKHCSSKLDIEEDENWCIECAEWICDDCRDSDPGTHVEADHTLVLYAERENGAVVADVNGGDGDKVIN